MVDGVLDGNSSCEHMCNGRKILPPQTKNPIDIQLINLVSFTSLRIYVGMDTLQPSKPKLSYDNTTYTTLI